MQTLLTDIELDIKELKYLIDTIERDPQSPLKDVARRSIRQMHAHLDGRTGSSACFFDATG